MTTAGQSASVAGALLADRFATAADVAACEAELAMKRVQPARARNLLPQLITAARSGDGKTRQHEQIIHEDTVAIAMAGIADTAKYTLAAAHAAQYAARAAEASGARRTGQRADRAAQEAISWASHAQHAADTSSYAPFTALMTATAARKAAMAARNAALAAGPLSQYSTRAVGIAVAILPRASRARYQEEWKSDLCFFHHWRERHRYLFNMFGGAIRLAFILRAPNASRRGGR